MAKVTLEEIKDLIVCSMEIYSETKPVLSFEDMLAIHIYELINPPLKDLYDIGKYPDDIKKLWEMQPETEDRLSFKEFAEEVVQTVFIDDVISAMVFFKGIRELGYDV